MQSVVIMEIIYGQPDKTEKALKHSARIHELMARLVLSFRPQSALEIGSGEGVVAARVATNGIRYVGIEPDSYSIEQAKASFPHLSFIRASSVVDPQRLKLGTFDLVFSNDVIEHVYEPRKFIAFAKAHLHPGGYFICGTPDYGSYMRNLLIGLANRWDQHHTVLWDGGHINFFSKRTLGQLIQDAGFRIERWEKLGRLPLVNSAIFCVARLT